ncbi:MAG: hypothetical protein ACTTKT_00160 [Prevotella veroralis]
MHRTTIRALLSPFYFADVINSYCLFNIMFMTIAECTDDLFRKN